MTFLKSDLLDAVPGVAHGFGTKREPIPLTLAQDWERAKPRWKQVHGVGIADVRTPAAECGEVDALFTSEPGQPIAVVTADCVPVLLARRDGGCVAAVHAGWRGTKALILRSLWHHLASRGERPEQWVAAIGPSIGPCCYEVSEELAADFAREFAWAGKTPAGASIAAPRHRHLDLPAVNAAELRAIGITEIDVIRACTRCSEDALGPLFHSYRREGGGTRQYSMIRREPHSERR